MKITVQVRTMTTKEVDVEFPLYYLYDNLGEYGSSRRSITRINEDGSAANISRVANAGDDREEWEISTYRVDVARTVGEYLDRGPASDPDESNREEWDRFAAKFRAYVAKVAL